MKYNLEKNFTFGFEIEGIFTRALFNSLEKKEDWGIKYDGSVKIYSLPKKEVIYLSDSEDYENDIGDEVATELNSPVFKSLEKMLVEMEKFTSPENYYRNESCGIHVHFRPKNEEGRILFNRIASFEGVKIVQKIAETLSPEIKDRINGITSSYCHKYSNKRNKIYYDWKRIKYRTLFYNDEYDTYELRFFSPLSKFPQEVKRFFSELLPLVEKMPDEFKKSIKRVKPPVELNLNLSFKGRENLLLETSF